MRAGWPRLLAGCACGPRRGGGRWRAGLVAGRLGPSAGVGQQAEGRGKTGPSDQNGDGRKFSLFFCFYLFQKLFKTHFKFILNLLDF